MRLGLVVAVVLTASGAGAVSDADVRRFVALSERFQGQLPRSSVAGLSQEQQRERARCILTEIEGRFGPGGVSDVMTLMNVLARGAEFDDPTIVRFNESYGGTFDRTVSACTAQVRS